MGFPLLWVSVAFLVGLLLEDGFHLYWWIWLLLAGFSLGLACADRLLVARWAFWQKLRVRTPLSVGLILLCAALGGLRSHAANLTVWNPQDLAWYNQKGSYLVTAWVSAPPDQREEWTVYEVNAIKVRDPLNGVTTTVKGRARVYAAPDTDWQYGDLLQFVASPQTPSDDEDFSYREYLAAFNIHTLIYYPQSVLKLDSGYGSNLRRGLIHLRQKAWSVIFAIFPQPEAGLLSGILLGMDNDLPASLAQAYRDTGLSHIIAISGFNMSVLAVLFLWFFSRSCGPYWAALISGVLLVIYTLFVDGSPAVVRALVMALVASGGHLIGRRQAGLTALAFTAAAMCLANPLLVSNISFQLSFAATFGLVTLAQPMQDGLQALLEKRFSEKTAKGFSKPFSEYFLFTIAAQLATLPVIALHFKRISLSSILANPLVLPVQPPLLVMGGITTLAGLLHPLAGKMLALFSWPLLKYTNLMVTWLSKIKAGALAIHPATAIWITILVVLFLLAFFLRNYFKKIFQSSRFIWIILGLGCAAATIWSIWAHRPDGLLHLRLQRCGEKVTLSLTTPSGETLLVNPSGDMNELAAALEKDLSPWDFHVDAVLLTNRASAEELAVLAERIAVQRVFLAPVVYQQTSEGEPILLPEGIEVIKLLSGQSITVEPEFTLSLLVENSQETAWRVDYDEFKALIPNGVDVAQLKTGFPDTLQGLTALVLKEEDVSYIPLRVWRALNPAAVLWASQALSPFTDSFGLDTLEELHLVSDGTQAWVAP